MKTASGYYEYCRREANGCLQRHLKWLRREHEEARERAKVLADKWDKKGGE